MVVGGVGGGRREGGGRGGEEGDGEVVGERCVEGEDEGGGGEVRDEECVKVGGVRDGERC